jgi:hypothetical protein
VRSLAVVLAAILVAACAPLQESSAQSGASALDSASPQVPASVAPSGPAAASATAVGTIEPQQPTLTPTARVSTPQPTVVAPQPTVATPRPVTPVPQPTARAGAYTTLSPGAALPSEAQCASEIARDPWEPRPENRTANMTNAWATGFRLRSSYIGTIFPAYEQRVTGNFTGTTNEIIRWAACKWGFDEEDVRAVAVIESTWRQSHLGDCRYRTQPETNGCASVGLMQIKGANIPATHPGTWPAALTCTAFNLDYTLAVRRLCYEGKETWLKQTNGSYAAGDLWGCIGRWFSGNWRDAAAERYITDVRATLNARPWLSPTF